MQVLWTFCAPKWLFNTPKLGRCYMMDTTWICKIKGVRHLFELKQWLLFMCTKPCFVFSCCDQFSTFSHTGSFFSYIWILLGHTPCEHTPCVSPASVLLYVSVNVSVHESPIKIPQKCFFHQVLLWSESKYLTTALQFRQVHYNISHCEMSIHVLIWTRNPILTAG